MDVQAWMLELAAWCGPGVRGLVALGGLVAAVRARVGCLPVVVFGSRGCEGASQSAKRLSGYRVSWRIGCLEAEVVGEKWVRRFGRKLACGYRVVDNTTGC